MNSQEAKQPTGRPMTSPANVINTLLAEMGAIRQETIESRDVKYNPKSGIGKDVSTIIGRIENGGLTRPKTSGIPSSRSQSSHGPQPPKASPSSTAHVYSNKGSSSNGKSRRPAQPKTPRSSSRPNVILIPTTSTTTSNSSSQFASAYSSSSSSPVPKLTASARSFTEDRHNRASSGSGGSNNSKKDIPPRPSTSFYRPYQSQPFKLKTTKSTIAPTILKTLSEMGEAGGDATAAAAAEKISAGPTLKEQFAAFSAFGDKTSDGKSITLTNCDKWMKQAKVIDGKKITTTDTSITFKKLFKTAKKISFEDFKKYIEELANSKKIEKGEIEEKLINCGPPGVSSATRAAHTGVVERLTDTKKYTGSHKERFDATGKGRGIEGRRDVGKSASPGGAVVRPKSTSSGTATPEKNGAASPSPVPPVSAE